MGGQWGCYVTPVGGWSSFCVRVCVCVCVFPQTQAFVLGWPENQSELDPKELDVVVLAGFHLVKARIWGSEVQCALSKAL